MELQDVSNRYIRTAIFESLDNASRKDVAKRVWSFGVQSCQVDTVAGNWKLFLGIIPVVAFEIFPLLVSNDESSCGCEQYTVDNRGIPSAGSGLISFVWHVQRVPGEDKWQGTRLWSFYWTLLTFLVHGMCCGQNVTTFSHSFRFHVCTCKCMLCFFDLPSSLWAVLSRFSYKFVRKWEGRRAKTISKTLVPEKTKSGSCTPAKSTQNSQQGKNEGRTTGHVVVSLSGMCYWLRSKWMMISWKHIWVSNEICPFQSGASSCIAPAGIEQWYVIVLEWHPSLLLVYGWMWLNRRQYTNISFLIICPFYNAGDGRSIWWLFGRSSRWYRCGILSGHA